MEPSRAVIPARQARAAATTPRLRLRPVADRRFEQLYQRHARDVYQYALALLANPADAEDVTQTTFLNAYRALQRGDRPHRPHNWLIAIAHNVCRMRWRQAGHRPREVALEDVPEPVALEHEQPSIDDVLHALSRLSFNQRAALVMRELEGRSCKEIAETLSVTVSAVEALLFGARRRLQVERRARGVLGTAPLPGSLASALGIGGGGGGATAGGIAAIGTDAVLKGATALVAAMAIAAGVVAVAKPKPTHRPASQVMVPAQKQTHKRATHARARARRDHPAFRARPSGARVAQVAAPASSGVASSLQPTVPATPPSALPQLPVPPPAVNLPPVQLPPLPVQIPPLPIQIPPLPPPPPLPPL